MEWIGRMDLMKNNYVVYLVQDDFFLQLLFRQGSWYQFFFFQICFDWEERLLGYVLILFDVRFRSDMF